VNWRARTPAGADVGPDQTIQSGSAALLYGQPAGSTAMAGLAAVSQGRKDDESGIPVSDRKFHFKGQKDVRPIVAKRRHKRWLGRQTGLGAVHQAMGGK